MFSGEMSLSPLSLRLRVLKLSAAQASAFAISSGTEPISGLTHALSSLQFFFSLNFVTCDLALTGF